MIVDNIIISSDVNKKSVDNPFGEGLIFLLNSLDCIDKAKEKFSEFNYTDFEKFINDKKENNEEIYEYEPVCYIKMDKNEIINSTLIKSKKCKYIYLLPVNGRDGDKKNFETQLMSLLFFGVQGKVNVNNLERVNEDNSNYIYAKFGDRSAIENIQIEIFGYKSSKKLFKQSDYGKWKFCDEKDLAAVVGIDKDPMMKISVMADVGRCDYKTDFRKKEDSVIDMVRVACYIHQIPAAVEMIDYLHNLGYETSCNIMAVSQANTNQIELCR